MHGLKCERFSASKSFSPIIHMYFPDLGTFVGSMALF